MFFKRNRNKQKDYKYRATYKSLYSGDVKEFLVVERGDAIVNFLQEGDNNVWESYMLTSVSPIDKRDSIMD